MARIFLGQPCYGMIEFEAADAVEDALADDLRHEVRSIRMSSSLLANCFNTLLVTCLNAGGFDYFALLHSDVSPSRGWLDTMIAEMGCYNLNVLHAPCALKTMNGTTSTAVAYSDDPWSAVRRLTVRELAKLWPTFTAGILREQLDPAIKHLLPNTGCMLIKIGPWLDAFPGFEIEDRIVEVRPTDRHADVLKTNAQVISEDWNFGFWCAANGVNVGGTTKVRTDHIGRFPFTTKNLEWGRDRDETYFEDGA
jgi:hypothetical protein